MKINKAKEKVQYDILRKWAEHGYKGTFIGATGIGKTKIGILASGQHIRNNSKQKWLIITPTEHLRDDEWKDEFIKWGYKAEMNKGVEIQCIQTAHKFKGKYFDGLIVDEIHKTLSSEHSKLYANNSFGKILGLTPSVIEEIRKSNLLSTIAPVFYEIDFEKALELQLISDVNIYCLPISFTEKEQREYNRLNKLFQELYARCNGDFEIIKRDKVTFLRRKICYNAKMKHEALKSILCKYPDEKALIFNEFKASADIANSYIGEQSLIYHSGLSKKQRKDALTAFKENYIKYLFSVRALDEGTNIPDCSLQIVMSGNSTLLQNTQRTGRSARLKENNKISNCFHLYVPGTVEERSVKKRLSTTQDVKWINNLSELDQLELF